MRSEGCDSSAAQHPFVCISTVRQQLDQHCPEGGRRPLIPGLCKLSPLMTTFLSVYHDLEISSRTPMRLSSSCLASVYHVFTDASLAQSQAACAKIPAVKLICIPNARHIWECGVNAGARSRSPCFTKLN